MGNSALKGDDYAGGTPEALQILANVNARIVAQPANDYLGTTDLVIELTAPTEIRN